MTKEQIYEAFGLEIKKHEGYFPGSRSYINNNPGNLRASPFQDGTLAGFAYFKTYERGWKALLYDIELKFTGKSRTGLGPSSTILKFFQVYAPAGDNNNPTVYAQAVVKGLIAKGLKVTINSTLGELLSLTEKQSMKILIQNAGVSGAQKACDEIAAFVKSITGGELDMQFNIVNVPDAVYPIIKPRPNDPYSVIDWNIQASLVAISGYQYIQLVYPPRAEYGNAMMTSYAKEQASGELPGFSQVNAGIEKAVNELEKWIMLHEIAHNWHHYLGIPDRTHYWVEHVAVENAPGQFTSLLLELKPYWSQLTSGERNIKMVAIKVEGIDTVYLPYGDLAMPVGLSWADFQVDFPGVKISTLSLAQFQATYRLAIKAKVRP